MAIAKRSQSNPWLPAAFVFIVLFVAAAVAAVVLYLNLEKQIKSAEQMQEQQRELINTRQWSSRGTLIGAKDPRETYTGLLLDYIDEMAYTILGAPREETSAEVKAQTVNKRINDFFAKLSQDYPDIGAVDVNTVGLLGTMGRMKNAIDFAVTTIQTLTEDLKQSEKLRLQTQEISNKKVQELTAERDSDAQQAQKVQQSYDQLKALMKSSSEQQVQVLLDDLESERERAAQLNQGLLKTQAELEVATQMLRDTRTQLAQFTGQPDMEPQIRQADAEILLVDDYSKTVHIDIGSEQRVYPGLTFGVYDRNVPIPRDGQGKAEIEVFNVADNMSTARIIKSSPQNPVLKGDVVANLVWSKDKQNIFVVCGDFDLDADGTDDRQADRKIIALIENWGGRVEQTVSVNTSFIVLGTTPTVLERPTYNQLAVDPLAMEKYEASLERLESYKEVKKQAQALNIPILNYERFLYLIGYKNQASRQGAFPLD